MLAPLKKLDPNLREAVRYDKASGSTLDQYKARGSALDHYKASGSTLGHYKASGSKFKENFDPSYKYSSPTFTRDAKPVKTVENRKLIIYWHYKNIKAFFFIKVNSKLKSVPSTTLLLAKPYEPNKEKFVSQNETLIKIYNELKSIQDKGEKSKLSNDLT